jgi:hypothetical protein
VIRIVSAGRGFKIYFCSKKQKTEVNYFVFYKQFAALKNLYMLACNLKGAAQILIPGRIFPTPMNRCLHSPTEKSCYVFISPADALLFAQRLQRYAIIREKFHFEWKLLMVYKVVCIWNEEVKGII